MQWGDLSGNVNDDSFEVLRRNWNVSLVVVLQRIQLSPTAEKMPDPEGGFRLCYHTKGRLSNSRKASSIIVVFKVGGHKRYWGGRRKFERRKKK